MDVFSKIFVELSKGGDRPALVEVQSDRLVESSAAELSSLIGRARGALHGAGLGAGQRVGLLAPNSARWVAADLAMLAEGAVVVPLYARQDSGELAGMLRDCGASLLVTATDELAAAMRAAWPEACPILTFEQLFSGPEVTGDPAVLAADETITIIYTSGTSGEPKGVMLSRSNVDYMVPQTVSALQEMRGARGGPERVFHYLPFCFAGSRMVLWTQLARPNPLMISTDLDDLKQEMATAEANYFLNVPALLERIRKGVNDMIRDKGGLARLMYERGEAAYLRSVEGQGRWLDGLWLAVGRKVFSKIRQRIGARLEFLICGSAPLSDETQRWFEMLGIPVLQVYGLTETTAIVTMDKPGRVVSGRVGLAIDGCELKLSEEGELLCRGPNIFQGYWGREEASADCLVDGWFATGDLAEIDPEGRVRIIGRAKNQLVLESGHNVAPEPIEQMLREACPAIEQAVVLGHGRPDLAVIVTGSVGGVALEAALERVNESLPHYRRLRRHHLASQAFTPESGLLTANQKLRRSVIEAHFEPVLQELYS